MLNIQGQIPSFFLMYITFQSLLPPLPCTPLSPSPSPPFKPEALVKLYFEGTHRSAHTLKEHEKRTVNKLGGRIKNKHFCEHRAILRNVRPLEKLCRAGKTKLC